MGSQIMGVSYPKIVYGSSTTVNLQYSRILHDEPDYDMLNYQSEINGDRNIYVRGYHWLFEILVYLTRYADPEAKWNEIFAAYNQEVDLYRYSDNPACKDSAGNVVKFRFIECVPLYLDDSCRLDACRCKFISTKFIDISKSID